MTKALTQIIQGFIESLEDKTYTKKDILKLLQSQTQDTTKTTITLTLGDAGENHIGMEMLGKLVNKNEGFTTDCLKLINDYYKQREYTVEYHDLSIRSIKTDEAAILIIRNYLDSTKTKQLMEELLGVNWDNKFWSSRHKRVLNKQARYNNVIVDGMEAEADYENGKGTIINTDKIKHFKNFKQEMTNTINLASNSNKADNLICEGNLYYDVNKCGIGYHGDAERRKVIAMRLGESMPINWQWFYHNRPIGDTFSFKINSGDLYIMSERAVGTDWKRSSIPTLRHAAGCYKYISLDRFKKS